jgi:hypothetical protein
VKKSDYSEVSIIKIGSRRGIKSLYKIIFKEYVYKYQTLKLLSKKYSRSMLWIMKQRDKLGTLVFKDETEKV